MICIGLVWIRLISLLGIRGKVWRICLFRGSRRLLTVLLVLGKLLKNILRKIKWGTLRRMYSRLIRMSTRKLLINKLILIRMMLAMVNILWMIINRKQKKIYKLRKNRKNRKNRKSRKMKVMERGMSWKMWKIGRNKVRGMDRGRKYLIGKRRARLSCKGRWLENSIHHIHNRKNNNKQSKINHNLLINKKPKNNKQSKIPKNPNNPNKNPHLPLLPLTNPKTPQLIPPPLAHPLLQNNNKYNQTKSSICNNIRNNKNNSKHINTKGTTSNNQMKM